MLTSLAKVTVPQDVTWEIIVVDNNSADETSERCIEMSSALPLRYLFEHRQGLSRARNTGIASATGSVLCFLDDDLLIDPQWLTALSQGLEQWDTAAGFGGKVLPLWGHVKKPRFFTDSSAFGLNALIPYQDLGEEPKVYPDSHMPAGGNMVLRREVFATIGLFREDMGRTGTALRGAEDVELFARMSSNDMKVVYLPKMTVFHPVDPLRLTTGSIARRYFWSGRDHIRLYGTHNEYKTFLGVYRYLYRQIVEDAVSYILGKVGVGRRDGFSNVVRILHNVGMAYELVVARATSRKDKESANGKDQPVA
jgi:glycosyltransferase involved in cell wall biosynthesis